MNDFPISGGQFWEWTQTFVLCPVSFLVVCWILYRALKPGGWIDRQGNGDD